MLDFDNIEKYDFLLEEKDKAFKIYKNNRGIHAFCVSRKFEYRDLETVEYMTKFKDQSIVNYIRFCYIRGFCVRLNKKFNGEHLDNYKLITTTNSLLVVPELERLVDLHMIKCQDFEHDLNLN